MNTFEGEQGARLLTPDPFRGMVNVLMSTEHVSETKAKSLLRLEESLLRNRGRFKYDLLLGVDKDSGDQYLAVKLIPDAEMGVNFDATQEAYLARYSNPGRIPLRTGYLQIDDKEIKEVRPVGLVEETTVTMEDILKLHFPNHQLLIQDIDTYGGF
jgi:hypothetical protein